MPGYMVSLKPPGYLIFPSLSLINLKFFCIHSVNKTMAARNLISSLNDLRT